MAQNETEAERLLKEQARVKAALQHRTEEHTEAMRKYEARKKELSNELSELVAKDTASKAAMGLPNPSHHSQSGSHLPVPERERLETLQNLQNNNWSPSIYIHQVAFSS